MPYAGGRGPRAGFPMRLTIRLFAGLRERAGRDQIILEDLPSGLDMGGLKRELEARHAELGPLAGVRGVVGTSYVADDTPLAEGQEISFLPPVSGGAPASEDESLERGRFEIRATALDAMAAHARVAHPSCGAVVLFTGMTRERNRGKAVERLDYEAFEEMAGREMERIFSACLARFGPDAVASNEDEKNATAEPDGPSAERRLRMLVLHRSGTVEVGQPSVVIAVASPHRDGAFRACRFLIDELKKSVPLWKKEIYTGGHHWIGDRS